MPKRRDLGNCIGGNTSFPLFFGKVVAKYTLIDNEDTRKKLRTFYDLYMRKWRTSNRSRDRFELNYKAWLDAEESLLDSSKASADCIPSTSSGQRGRPRKSFEEAQERTKKKIAKKEADQFTTPQATRVLSSRLRRKGSRCGSAAVKIFANESPRSSKRMFLEFVNKIKH